MIDHPSYAYARAVVDGTAAAPKYVKTQAAEYLDMCDGLTPGWTINWKRAKKIGKLLKLMVMPKGLKAGQTMDECFVGYQWLLVTATLCAVSESDPKQRRYETAILEIARKNFKTYTIAVLFLLLMFLEPNLSKLYSVAPDGTLSRAVREAIVEILKVSPALRPPEEPERYFKIRLSDITFKGKDTQYIPLNYSTNRLDSRLPTAFLADEAGALPNGYAIQAMRSGQLTIRNKLGVIVSTKYPTFHNPFEDEVAYAKRVLDGVVDDPHVFALLYEPDNPKDWMFDDLVMKHANPAAIDIPEIWEDLLKKRQRAIELRSERENFLCKHCDITWQGLGTEQYVALDDLRQCKSSEKLTWQGMGVYLGCDLSMTEDNCSVAMAGESDDGMIQVDAVAFIPEDRVDEKSALENCNYKRFIEEMKCVSCGDKAVDYAVIEDFVFSIEKKYGVAVLGIGYDRMNCMSSAQKWERGIIDPEGNVVQEGYPTVVVRQHSDTLHAPTKLLKELILRKRLLYEENELLEINFENAVCTFDSNMNRYVKKKICRGKVDMVVALINAMYLLQQNVYLSDDDWAVQAV